MDGRIAPTPEEPWGLPVGVAGRPLVDVVDSSMVDMVGHPAVVDVDAGDEHPVPSLRTTVIHLGTRTGPARVSMTIDVGSPESAA